jgi:hypothetical protein
MAHLDLTTLERVKRRLGQTDPTAVDTQMDTLIGVLIDAVSSAFAAYLGVTTMTTEERTEVYSGRKFQSEIELRNVAPRTGAPTITTVKTRGHWSTDWADVTALTDGEDFALVADGYGRIAFAQHIPEGRDTVQVVYTHGFATTAANLVADYPDIADAADAQVVYEYQRRKEPGQSTISMQGAAHTQQEVRLLTAVRGRLAPYERVFVA